MNAELKEKIFNVDIRRTIILGAYIDQWGMPDQRVISSKGDDSIEIYSFPPRTNEKVWRVASVNMSGIARTTGEFNPFELFMTLPQDLGGSTFQSVAEFLMDIFAYSINKNINLYPEQTIPETHLMPQPLKPKAVLFDEPRGEPENICEFQIGIHNVKLLWVVPIYEEERRLILKEGINAFDELDEVSDFSLADTNRPSFVNDSPKN